MTKEDDLNDVGNNNVKQIIKLTRTALDNTIALQSMPMAPMPIIATVKIPTQLEKVMKDISMERTRFLESKAEETKLTANPPNRNQMMTRSGSSQQRSSPRPRRGPSSPPH